MKIKIGVFFGGRSVEHEISVISALQAIAVMDKNKYDILPVYITKDGEWYTGNSLTDIEKYKDIPTLLKNCQKILLSNNFNDGNVVSYQRGILGNKILGKIDIAFPILHGTFGEDGCIQGLFELMGIPYVGSNVLASAIGMDKIVTKAMLGAANLPIVPYIWFHAKTFHKHSQEWKEKIANLGYPIIVKPANLGSSVGISKVQNENELDEAISLATQFSQRILVEKMVVDLREINCSVIGNYEHCEPSECEEPLRSGEILSYQDKYVSKTGTSKGMQTLKRKVPADLSLELSRQIKEFALKTFQTLDCAGVARIDFLFDTSTNQIFVNEINTIPGSLSFYLWEATNKSFIALINNLLEIAWNSHREKSNLTVSYQANIFNFNFNSLKMSK